MAHHKLNLYYLHMLLEKKKKTKKLKLKLIKGDGPHK